MPNCPHCNKNYKTNGRLNNHILINHSDKVNIEPTKKEMWETIQHLIKKINEQEKKIIKLEKIVNKDVKNINMIDVYNRLEKLPKNMYGIGNNFLIKKNSIIENILKK